MSDVVSIELLLDAALDEAVRAEWESLRDAGLPSLATHRSDSNRPHVTLLARRALPEFDAVDLLGLLPFPVQLGAPILFGSGARRVLARSVIPSSPLLRLHAAVHARAGDGADADLPHTVVGRWTPHVTLARRIPIELVPAALASIGDAPEGRATALRRWDSATRTVTPLGIAHSKSP